MIQLTPPYRMATPDDAASMAELVNFAGEGMPLYLWTRMAAPGESAWDVGRQRARREEGAFSFRNTVVCELSGNVVASLVGYPLPESPQPSDYDTLPPMSKPLQQLEDLAPGTWYINVLATYPEFRGQGLGSQLLSIAAEVAEATACSGLSLIVSDANLRARQLYERHGFIENESRPMVKEGWQNDGRNWILLTKRKR